MTRTALFDAIRPFAPDKRFTPAMVTMIDDLADRFGLARLGKPSPSNDGAIALIKQFEGCKLNAYPDPGTGGDPWTIGWGATGPGIRKGVTWTQTQADERLAADVDSFARGVDEMMEAMTPSQRSALISFAYNVGLQALKDSTLRKMHSAGDYDGAAGQFLRWNRAGGKILAGLTRRREAEARVYKGLAA